MYNVSLTLAQTNYYTTTKTFNEQGYTYQCDVVKASARYMLMTRVRLIMIPFSK